MIKDITKHLDTIKNNQILSLDCYITYKFLGKKHKIKVWLYKSSYGSIIINTYHPAETFRKLVLHDIPGKCLGYKYYEFDPPSSFITFIHRIYNINGESFKTKCKRGITYLI